MALDYASVSTTGPLSERWYPCRQILCTVLFGRRRRKSRTVPRPRLPSVEGRPPRRISHLSSTERGLGTIMPVLARAILRRQMPTLRPSLITIAVSPHTHNNKVADALQWVMSHNFDVAPVIHYLDDYLGGATDSIGAQHQLDRALVACHDLGFPVNPKKVEGPNTTLTFLGVMLDTERFEIRLPSDKLEDLLIALKAWQHTRPTARKSELLSLIGHLSFACKAVPAGRMFLRRLIDLSTTVPNPNVTKFDSLIIYIRCCSWSRCLVLSGVKYGLLSVRE